MPTLPPPRAQVGGGAQVERHAAPTCAPSNAPAVLNGTIIAAGVALAAGALALVAATRRVGTLGGGGERGGLVAPHLGPRRDVRAVRDLALDKGGHERGLVWVRARKRAWDLEDMEVALCVAHREQLHLGSDDA